MGKKNRVILLLAAVCLALAGTIYGAAGDGWSTKVHMEQGGDQQTIESGGIVEFKDGGILKQNVATVTVVNSATSLAVLGTHSGKIITNTGATAAETFTLPAASTSTIGYLYEFIQTDTDAIKVTAAGTNTILGTSNNSYVTNNTPGNAIRIIGLTATSWGVLCKEGTWTDTTGLP